jgi:hypothetical protein
VSTDDYYDSEQDMPGSDPEKKGKADMGKRLAALDTHSLLRVARDSRFSDAAHHAAKQELKRRALLMDPCPRGAGCTDFDCERLHA